MSTKITLDQFFALAKEIYETSPDASIEITAHVSSSAGCKSELEGFAFYSHHKGIEERNEYLPSGGSPNPHIITLHRSPDFQKLCRKHGIESEYNDGCC